MMRSINRWTLVGGTALAALGAVPVFDVGAPAAEAAPSVSPFAGNWFGAWTGVDNGDGIDNEDDGTFDWTISGEGRLSGRVYHAQDGDSGGGAIRGHVGADGRINMVVFAPADDRSHGNGFPYKITAVINGEGKLDLSITGTFSSGESFVGVLERY